MASERPPVLPSRRADPVAALCTETHLAQAVRRIRMQSLVFLVILLTVRESPRIESRQANLVWIKRAV